MTNNKKVWVTELSEKAFEILFETYRTNLYEYGIYEEFEIIEFLSDLQNEKLANITDNFDNGFIEELCNM